jgi:2-polyprenyl-6-methoxyphenol hydroxylase-like FAD-dependent oxidoreductase
MVVGKPETYDLIVVGGGLAGSSLAIAMAQAGTRVLIIEREAQFRDRVRGEGMLPWGAAEASDLGVYEPLLDRCAISVPWWVAPDGTRDLVATSPSRLGCLNFYHPEMQQTLLDRAVASGAELLRPADAAEVVAGDPPTVLVRANGSGRRVAARIVVGADGRNSQLRTRAGFAVNRDPDCLTVAGVLLRDLALPDDAVQFVVNPMVQRQSIIFPIGQRRFRAYVVFPHEASRALSGAGDTARFIELSVATGASASWFEPATVIGPLASFNAPDTWVERPYRDGIALVGDAAAASDPSFGCGLSLTLRDTRVLRDRLLAMDDWAAAADAYAAEHDLYAASLRRIHGWFRELFHGTGEAADALRVRALPQIAQDPSRIVDFIGCGPEAPSDEAARRRFFGED